MKKTFARKWGSFLPKITLVVFLTLLSISLYAQTEITTAKNYLTANAAKQKLSAGDINEMIVSSAYLSPTTGWYHIYFNQTYQSVEVYNGLLNTVIKDGQVAYVTSNFIENIASKAPVPAASLSPVQALQKAALAVNMTASEPTRVQTVSSSNLPNGAISKSVLKDGQLSNENIEVKLYWYAYEAVENEKVRPKVALTWNVRFETKDSQNIWNMQVDATTGEILQKVDDVIHCSFGTPNHLTAPHICAADHTSANQEVKVMGMGMLAPNTYNVFDYPLESPNHGGRTLVSSPYTKFVPATTGPGTTNGWHNDGTTDYIITRGNNVWAKEDLNATNESPVGASPSSATLEFDFPITPGNAAASQNAAITNLFYWNNLIHDVLWKYGFDEAGGNFQNDNLGRGGTGGDYVLADAQDGNGVFPRVNNANFSTPVDGGRGRMQMYLWDLSSPAPDGDFDNGVISHEYGHGWSIRLTGGPANSSCLNNAEQGGEGWADYNALMLTTNWAGLTPTLASANISRGIGTYVLGEPTTGPGIRPFPYSYDKTNVNNSVTYAKVGDVANFSQPHGIGSIWATMLWDMTWEIILQDNQIVNDIYNVPANVLNMRGNVAALKLVNEGLRLQPCSPSFVQARDAIFQADQMLFNGRYRCAIGRAFARRGLGLNASTGASTNDRTVTEDFTPFTGPVLNSPLTNTVCNNQAFNYTGTTASMGSFTFAWTRAAVLGISNPAANANVATINETLINTTANPVEVTYVFTISPDECGGTPTPQPVKVVVNPSPIPTVGTYSVCQNGTVPMGEGLVVPDGAALTDLVNGSLTNASPTYNRGVGSSTTYTASSVGTAVYYQTFTFVSPVNGNVTFSTTNIALSGSDPDDTYLTLYQTAFNPAAPATNFLRGDDDSGPGFASALTHPLVQGSTYVLVVATFSNGVTGTFSLQASAAGFSGGPGITQWYKDPSGGAPLATGSVFNPVGVMGSGVPNTATPGTTMFYVAYNSLPDCRTPVSFVIKPLPMVSITGASSICQGATTTLSPTTGGTWVSNAPAIASVSNAGLVTGLAPGMATFTFTETATGCSNTTGSVTIKPLPSSALSASKLDVCPNTEVTLNANCSEVGSIVNWNPGGATVTPNAPDIAYTYKASCTLNGCTGNESSIEVRTHRILVDLKDVGLGAQPKAIIGAIKDNLSPTNAISAAVSPRLWTILATGCSASESAVFKLTGPVSFSSIDNNPPYAIFANVGTTYFSIDHPNYGNGGSSFPNGIYNLVVDLRAADGVGGPFPKNRIATGSLLATRSLQFTVSTGGGRLGIEDLSLAESNWASIFQNPVSEEIVVRISGTVGEEVSLGLVNLQGQTVQSRQVKLSSPQQYEVLNVRQQNAGMYILKAIKGDKVKTIKVVKAE